MKKPILLFLFIGIAIALPLSFVYATSPFSLSGVLMALPSLFVTLIFKLVMKATEVILHFTDFMLGWIANDPFSKTLSFTNPAANPIIQVGWTLLRDMVNMFFILGIAYIGLATALDVGRFKTKKAFGKLILIALIINFTPVICGVIVDASNLVGNFFLKGISFKVIAERYAFQQGLLSQHLTDLLTSPTVLMQSLMMMAYGLGASFVLLIFSFLLLMRYVFIWLAVILSPLAFFFSIFEGKMKSLYDQWWSQFTQWSFIIIPAGFFLYISRQALANVDKFSDYTGDPSAGFFPALSPYIIGLLFLYIGFFMTTKISAMGAGIAINKANQVAKLSGKLAGGGAFLGAAGLRRFAKRSVGTMPGEEGWEDYKKEHKGRAAVKEAASSAVRFAFGNMTDEERQRWGKGKKALKGAAKVGAGLVTLGAPFWAKRALKEASVRMDDAEDEAIRKIGDKFDSLSPGRKKLFMDNAMRGKGPLARRKRIGALQKMVEKGEFANIYKNPKERNAVSEKVFDDIIKTKPELLKSMSWVNINAASKLANNKKIPRSSLAKAGLTITDKDREKGITTIKNKLFATLSPNKMQYLDKDTALEAAESLIAHHFWSSSHIAKGADLFGAEFLRSIKRGMLKATETVGVTDEKEAVRKQKEFYDKHNPYLGGYFSSSPAQALGIGYGSDTGAYGKIVSGNIKSSGQITEKGKPTQEKTGKQTKIVDGKVDKLEEKIRKTSEELKKMEEERNRLYDSVGKVEEDRINQLVYDIFAKKKQLDSLRSKLRKKKNKLKK